MVYFIIITLLQEFQDSPNVILSSAIVNHLKPTGYVLRQPV